MRVKVNREKRKSIALKLVLNEVILAVPEEVEIKSKEILKSFLGKTKLKFKKERVSEKEFIEMTRFWQQKIGVSPKRIQMRKMTQKWASCSKNKIITFNCLLLSMPKDFVEYIICHELLHLKVPNHSKLFFSFLGSYLPNWQRRLKETVKFLINIQD